MYGTPLCYDLATILVNKKRDSIRISIHCRRSCEWLLEKLGGLQDEALAKSVFKIPIEDRDLNLWPAARIAPLVFRPCWGPWFKSITRIRDIVFSGWNVGPRAAGQEPRLASRFAWPRYSRRLCLSLSRLHSDINAIRQIPRLGRLVVPLTNRRSSGMGPVDAWGKVSPSTPCPQLRELGIG